MDLANKIEEMLTSTQSGSDKKILEHYLSEVKSGKEITEEELTESLKSSKNLPEQFRKKEMESSKEAASKLMESWDSGRFSSKNSGSYSDKSEEVVEASGDDKFYEMSREDLLGFIFDEEEEAGEEALAKYSDEDLIEIAIEKNSKKEMESVDETEKARASYKPLGVTKAISKLSNSSIFEHSSFKVLIGKYSNLMKSHNLPESIIVENFVNELGNFEWDDVVKKEKESLSKVLKESLAEVEVEKAIFSIKRSAGWKFYAEAANIMNEWLQEGSNSNKLLSKNLRTWSFNPIIGNLINKLNEMESKETGSLNIPSQQGESFVAKVYSPIFLSENNTYFSIGGKYFRANTEGVVTINEESIDNNFKSLNEAFSSKNLRINEKGIIYYVGKDKISIVNENDSNFVYVNTSKLSFDNKNMLAKLLESKFSGVLGSNGSKSVYDIIRLYENFDSIVELDFIKSVRSKLYEGAEVNLIKWEGKIYVNKVNPSMNENSLYPSNGRQAVKFVKEYLNYDISEGLTEYLEGEDKIKSVMVNDRTKVLENLKVVENELAKINNAIGINSKLSDSEEIKKAKEMLENNISKLKEKWATINSEIEKFDSIDYSSIESITEDEKFNIGSLVKIKESGDTGKVISIDGSSGSYTVLHDNGQTGEYKIDEIVDLEEALSKTPGEETEGSEETSGEEAEGSEETPSEETEGELDSEEEKV